MREPLQLWLFCPKCLTIPTNNIPDFPLATDHNPMSWSKIHSSDYNRIRFERLRFCPNCLNVEG